MTGIFGDYDTPQAPRRAISEENRLSEIAVTIHEATHDPIADDVHLRAEVQLGRIDGTAPSRIAVVFFINGRQVAEATSDDFGLASLDIRLRAHLLKPENNELTARVRGQSLKGTAAFAYDYIAPVAILHRWMHRARAYSANVSAVTFFHEGSGAIFRESDGVSLHDEGDAFVHLWCQVTFTEDHLRKLRLSPGSAVQLNCISADATSQTVVTRTIRQGEAGIWFCDLSLYGAFWAPDLRLVPRTPLVRMAHELPLFFSDVSHPAHGRVFCGGNVDDNLLQQYRHWQGREFLTTNKASFNSMAVILPAQSTSTLVLFDPPDVACMAAVNPPTVNLAGAQCEICVGGWRAPIARFTPNPC